MTRFPSFRLPALLLALAFTLSACDASLDDEAADLTAAEADEAAEIVAEALAEDGAGLFTSARDLTASLTDEGLIDGPFAIHGPRAGHGPDHVRCRGGDFELTYDEETGTHLVSYSCSIEGDHFQKSYDAQLTYQYRDADGGFVPRPVENWESVDSVAFGGTREGDLQFSRGEFSSESAFEQQGQWSLAGLNDEASPARLAGSQTRSGTRVRTAPRGTVSRDYTVELTGRGIEITPNDEGPGYAAVGELDYVLTMEVIRDDRVVTRTVEGTIELETDGRALLRIIGLRGVYRVSLGDGSVSPV